MKAGRQNATGPSGHRRWLLALSMALLLSLCPIPAPRVARAAQTTIQPGPTDGVDTELDDDYPSNNYGASNYLYFFMLSDAESWKVDVSLIKFDLSSLAGQTITSVTFYFYESDNGAGWHDRGTVYAHRILSANSEWTEGGATWNHKVASSHWAGDLGGDHGADAGCTQSGVDWDATPLGSVNCGNLDLPDGHEFSMSWGLTEFQEMMSANYGFICYSTSGLGPIPYSSDYTTDPSLRPKLVVQYSEGTVLLTYNSKYVVASATAATTTSTSLQDDAQAIQDFSLTASQTILAIYQANSVHGDLIPQAYGMQNAIMVDGTDYAKSWDSGVLAHRATRNAAFWIGKLNAGSHTIKGRFASGSSGSTATVSNRILLIYILNGDAFLYLDSSTNSTTSGTTFADDPAAQFNFTPPGSCKALILYNVANYYSAGQSENENGKKIAIYVGGTDYAQAEKSPYDDTYPGSVFTAWALGLSASSTTVKGRFACSIASSVYINRRQLGILMFADSTLLDTVSSDTQVSTSSTDLVDDGQATISRTTADERELLVVAMGTKRYGTSDSDNGLCYGIMVDDNDRANSRGSPHASGVYANSAASAYAENLVAGGHTIKGRYATNYVGGTTKIDSRRIVALWLSISSGPQPAPNFAFTDGGDVSIGTGETALATLTTSSFDSGNNFVIAVVEFSSTASTYIGAGNLRLTRGGTTLRSNAYDVNIGSSGVNRQKWHALMAFDSGAPQNPTYDVRATAAATGISGEAKILAISGLNGASVQGSSTAIGQLETTMATLPTSLPAGDNVVLAILESQNLDDIARTVSALNLKRGSTLASAQYSMYYTAISTVVGNWQVQLIPFFDSGAPASAQYTVTAISNIGNTNDVYGRATIVAFSKGTLTTAYSDGGSTAILASETEINYLTTSFIAGSDVAVIASQQFDNTGSSTRTIAAGIDKLQQNDQATGQTTNQYIMRIPTNGGNDDGKGFGLLNLFANIASSSPEYEVKTTASATSVNGEAKMLALCKPPKVPEYPLGPTLTLAVCFTMLFMVRRWKRTA